MNLMPVLSAFSLSVVTTNGALENPAFAYYQVIIAKLLKIVFSAVFSSNKECGVRDFDRAHWKKE